MPPPPGVEPPPPPPLGLIRFDCKQQLDGLGLGPMAVAAGLGLGQDRGGLLHHLETLPRRPIS